MSACVVEWKSTERRQTLEYAIRAVLEDLPDGFKAQVHYYSDDQAYHVTVIGDRVWYFYFYEKKHPTFEAIRDEILKGVGWKPSRSSKNKGRAEIGPDWKPTAENVSALPKPLRRYAQDLIANRDPGYLVRENILLRQQVYALTVMVDALKRSLVNQH
jgi:hypothetical protein